MTSRSAIARMARAAKRVPFSQPGNADYSPIPCRHGRCLVLVLYPISRLPAGPNSTLCSEHAGTLGGVEVIRVPDLEVTP